MTYEDRDTHPTPPSARYLPGAARDYAHLTVSSPGFVTVRIAGEVVGTFAVASGDYVHMHWLDTAGNPMPPRRVSAQGRAGA
jgi:hypothetical protein